MRIAVWHNLPSGGGKRALYDQVSGLVEQGHEVEIWAPPTQDGNYLPLGDLAPEHIVPLDHRWEFTWTERWQFSLYINQAIAAMDVHCARCAAEIDSGGFDVLFANSCQFYRTTSIGRLSKTPSVIYLQEPYRWLYEAMPNNRWAAPDKSPVSLKSLKQFYIDIRNLRNARIQVREEIKNARGFDRILCNSYFSRESILRAYGIDAQVCYLGIDSSHFQPTEAPRGHHIVGLGALTPEKNVELCVRAIAKMEQPRPVLIWICNVVYPSYGARIRTLATELGVDFDQRTGIPDAELIQLLTTAQAMIYAPRLEPFGLAPLEAGACSTPVVAVGEGGVRETVIDGLNGLLTDGTPTALAAALMRLERDPELAAELGRRGRKQVEEFWSKDAATIRLIKALELCALPSASGERLASMILCKICGGQSEVIFITQILRKYKVSYHRCVSCGFVQTDEPYWLNEAYTNAINEIDIGVVNRAVTASDICEGLILSHFGPDIKSMDFGAGYGLFVRIMRDKGYDFSWFDEHCENIFAKQFSSKPEASYDLVTAFEVLEHLVDPLKEIRRILSNSRNFFFSTLLIPDEQAFDNNWWYVGPDHGQHVSFFTTKSLMHIANMFGLHLVSDNFLYHMLSDRPINSKKFRWFVRGRLSSALYRKYMRRRLHVRSLQDSDFEAVVRASRSD